MKIFDENNNIIKNPDLTAGKLEEESREITHRYVITQEGKGHFETIKEYPNGGKDVDWVVDIPEQGEWKTFDASGAEIETDIIIPDDAPHELEIPDIENYCRYILFTDEELKEFERNEVEEQISELKQKLADTDYTIIKIAEGAATWDEYPEIKKQRQAWRDEINKLEATE